MTSTLRRTEQENPIDWLRSIAPDSLRLTDATQRLSVTIGEPDDSQLGFSAGREWSGSTVNVWMRDGRRKLSRGLGRDEARALAADLLVMADALDAWYPVTVPA